MPDHSDVEPLSVLKALEHAVEVLRDRAFDQGQRWCRASDQGEERTDRAERCLTASQKAKAAQETLQRLLDEEAIKAVLALAEAHGFAPSDSDVLGIASAWATFEGDKLRLRLMSREGHAVVAERERHGGRCYRMRWWELTIAARSAEPSQHEAQPVRSEADRLRS